MSLRQTAIPAVGSLAPECEKWQPSHGRIESSLSWLSITQSFFEDKKVLLTSANHSVIHSHASNFRLMPPYMVEDIEPDFTHMQRLLAALLLSTLLACCAAFDANHQCLSANAYDVYDQFIADNDASNANDSDRSEGEAVCRQIFQRVAIPVGSTISICGVLGLCLLRRHMRTLGSVDSGQSRHYTVLIKLSFIMMAMLAAWVYGIVAIMLRPRSVQTNPYQSLAAVDSMGHVGDNANLYYTTWISLGLSMALAYQAFGDLALQYGRKQMERMTESAHVGDVEAMLSSLTVFQLQTYRESRAMWYQSLYRLRTRTGIWTSTFLATLLVMASSVHIWQEVLIPTAASIDPDVKYRDVCSVLVGSDIPSSLCARTAFSLLSGIIAACLSFGAIVTHMLARRDAARVAERRDDVTAPRLGFPSNVHGSFRRTFLPLQYEFILAVILSNMLGLNAVVATAVHGPAATVGNLYYANWISFLLCLRICLGCLEELCNIDDESQLQSTKPGDYDPPTLTPSTSSKRSEACSEADSLKNAEAFASEQSQRRRAYLLLGIASTVCSASAFDAAMYQVDALRIEQRYVISAPSIVAVICACLFLLCLKTSTYRIVSQMWLGGLLSVLTCGVCIATLVITMHSESSWAVNGIGEIQIANLYYFTWASVFTAGWLMMSYAKNYLGLNDKDYVTAIWAGICKVCFVILAAGFHVWRNISDVCTVDYIRSGAVTFCSRTVISMAVAFAGMLISGLIAAVRVLITTTCPNAKGRLMADVEMVASVFLVLLFGPPVALITGIGGPGQSVGDLFYATWLAFLVALGLVVACFEEIARVETVESLRTEDVIT
ncbi:hypothetical protein MHU86_16216 [Fragilaria crotonensis]|nr:hypothetical protein MHU86_16216 [Fragilaria crotonensis]